MVNNDGKALAKQDEMVVFIQRTIPEVNVDVIVHRKKNNIADAIVQKFLSYSSDRETP